MGGPFLWQKSQRYWGTTHRLNPTDALPCAHSIRGLVPVLGGIVMRAWVPIIASFVFVVPYAIPVGAQPGQSTAPHANRMSQGDLQAYQIFLSNSPPLKVWLTASVPTDSCNTIFL